MGCELIVIPADFTQTWVCTPRACRVVCARALCVGPLCESHTATRSALRAGLGGDTLRVGHGTQPHEKIADFHGAR